MAPMRPSSPYFAVVWLIAAAGFIVTAAVAASHDRFSGDVWLARRSQGLDGAAFARIFDWTEDFADWPLLAIVIAFGTIMLFVFAQREASFLLLISTAGRLLNSGVKEFVERPRPTPGSIDVTCDPDSTFSFPSGHSEGAIVLYGLIFYFAGVYLRALWLRLPLQAVCVWIVLVTGVERVYAGCHWPSDVLGGFYLGFLVLVAVIVLHRLVISVRKE